MSKYNEEFTEVAIKYKYQLMQILANELAEANRLKRIELSHKLKQLPDHKRPELDDRA